MTVTSAVIEYKKETLGNERGMVTAGSPAAALMAEATTSEVRRLQKEATERYGFTPQGCEAAQAAAVESRRLRIRPLEMHR